MGWLLGLFRSVPARGEDAWPQPGWEKRESSDCCEQSQRRRVLVLVRVCLALCNFKQTDDGHLYGKSSSSRMAATGSRALETVPVDCDTLMLTYRLTL